MLTLCLFTLIDFHSQAGQLQLMDLYIQQRLSCDLVVSQQKALAQTEKQRMENELKVMASLVDKQEKEREDRQIKIGQLELHVQCLKSESQRIQSDLQERLDYALAELHKCSPKAPQLDSLDRWSVSHSDVRVLEEIGRGGWGVVNRGIFRGEVVAIKQPHQYILTQPLVDRIRRETTVMMQICHPNLVRIIAVVFDRAAERLGQPPLIITELFDMNLRHCYLQGRLEQRNRVSVFRDVAYGLRHLHTCPEPIIHRDVSAPNILLKALANGKWMAKVSDFGSANHLERSVTPGEGAIVYTAPEMFPAQYPRLPHTVKIDVYSFGILMCEVMTERQPDPEVFEERLEEVSGPLRGLIVRCTDRDPEKRPTMAAVITELNMLP